jgi:phage-related protein
MAWVVELLDGRVQDELDALPPDMQARFRRVVELVQAYGLEQVLRIFVKRTQKAPQREIEIALQRAQEVGKK